MITKRKKRPDFLIALIVFALVILGLVMITSASVVTSYEITEGKSNYYFLTHQLIAVGIGFFVWLAFYSIDYNKWKKWAIYIFLFSIILLFLVFMPGIGKSIGGAYRWIGIGSFSFQPSEFVKLAIILYLAAWLDKKREKVADFWHSFLPFVLILGAILYLVVREPDMGTAIILGIIAVGMYFVAGANILYLILSLPVLGGLFWFLVKKAPYRLARITAFLDPSRDVLGISYHIHQTLIAIGSGGLWGLGFGNSRQKYNYLPEAHTDSIFAIICEELGFLRAIFVIILFAVFALAGLGVAKRAPNNFGRLLAFGIVLWFVAQAFVNLAVMLGLLPFTGVPLPFISFGGSSLVISLAAVGILLNISKQTNR